MWPVYNETFSICLCSVLIKALQPKKKKKKASKARSTWSEFRLRIRWNEHSHLRSSQCLELSSTWGLRTPRFSHFRCALFADWIKFATSKGCCDFNKGGFILLSWQVVSAWFAVNISLFAVLYKNRQFFINIRTHSREDKRFGVPALLSRSYKQRHLVSKRASGAELCSYWPQVRPLYAAHAARAAFARPLQMFGTLPQQRKKVVLPHERRRISEFAGEIAPCSTGLRLFSYTTAALKR